MPKRKRDQQDHRNEDVVDGPERRLRLRQRQLEGAIDLSKKNVFRALKVGRGFERQKLGRRQNAAKEKKAEDEIARLNAEIAVLKGLDLAATAELHVYKTLVKTKSVAASSSFPRHILSKVENSAKPHDVAYANITARLYNSNPVKLAMAEVMTTVRGILGLEDNQSVRKKRLRTAELKEITGVKEEEPVKVDATGGEPDLLTNSAPTKAGFHDSITVQKDCDETKDEDTSNHDQYISRLANSSSDAMSDDEEGIAISASDIRQSSYSPFGDKALSPPISHPSVEIPRPRDKTNHPRTSATGPTTSTTFLPSLTMGGFYSGSESGSVEDEGTADIKPRKNRMGQQARRQLWEKKFGQRANHIQKQSRELGWDACKGALGGGDRGQRGRRGGRGGTGLRPRVSRNEDGQRTSGANSDPIQTRKEKVAKAVDGPLHPSWEAAKKAKEHKGNVAFTGTKVVFD